MDEDRIANIISINRATPLVKAIEHSRRFKVSKTSSEDNPTLYKTNLHTENGLPTPKHTNPLTSNEDIPESKETLHGSQNILLEDNCDSLIERTSSPSTPQNSVGKDNS